MGVITNFEPYFCITVYVYSATIHYSNKPSEVADDNAGV